MNWPWVSRALYDAMVLERDRWSDLCRDEHERYATVLHGNVPRETYDDLLAKYHALKLVGGGDVPRHEKKEVDMVTKAIIAKSRNSPILRKQFSEYVASERSQGVSEAEIADAILAGDEYTGGLIG